MADQNNYGATIPERLTSALAPFQEAMTSLARGLHVAVPATPVTFNPQKQTVVVQPAVKEITRKQGTLTVQALPQLFDVPVLLPRAGGFTLTLPIQAGDECLVIFSDQCMDSWFQAGGTQAPMSARRHSLSDGCAWWAYGINSARSRTTQPPARSFAAITARP